MNGMSWLHVIRNVTQSCRHGERTGRPKAELTVTDQERETLQRWARRPKSAQQLALRAKIVLACAEGKDNKTVAAELAVHQVTVGKWRSRFIAGGWRA